MPQDGPDGRTDARARRGVPDTLRQRLLLVAFAVLVPLLLGAGIWIMLLSHSSDGYRQLAREATHESNASVGVLRDLNEAEDAGGAYLRSGERSDLQAFQQIAAQIDRELSTGAQYDESREIIALVSIRRPWGLAKRSIAAGPREPGATTNFDVAVHSSISGLQRLMSASQVEVDDELADSQQDARLNWLLGFWAVAIAVLLATLLASRLSRSLARPLEQLARAARSVAAGNLDHRVEINSTVELNEVGRAFNTMAQALERQREELERQAFTDSLTGLANRALFEDRISHALGRVSGGPQRIAVIVLDVDGFKLVNDGLGHACGDALLHDAAERLTGTLRPSDTLARLGSDEFAVLLEDIRGLDDALGAAERLRQAFGDPFLLKGSEVRVTASLGIALSSESTRDEAELLRRADMAMYRAKQHGRNACEFFDPAMDDQAADRLDMVNALRRAVDRDELVVHYQPIVDLDGGAVRAAEALLRWNRPGRGLVAPLDFIPLAEETGVIVALGEWVLNEACREAREWSRSGAGDLPVTVNVSARQLLDPGFESAVASALARSGLEPARLILEVTESSVMQNADVTIAKLDRVSATGVRIALDDFGEGYSSLSQLRELPIDILKIARPFIRELTDDEHDPALVRGIIELARSLGLRLVAEGIEYPEQQAMLRAFGCPLGQGFLFARPLEAEQMHALLDQRQHARVTRSA